MNTTAPIRQVTLNKHGAAHIVREAEFEGSELGIFVKHADLDDALTSCTVGGYTPGTTATGIDAVLSTPAESGP